MTDYTELIRSLRNCSNNRCTPCDCGWFDKYQVDESCKEIIMWKAAAAIEDMAKHITEMHERVTVLQIARGELEAEVKRLNMRCADCEYGNSEWPEDQEHTKMPKRGEWKETDMGWDGDTAWVCSVCGEPWTLIDGTPKENNMNYCPNCGAKMMEVQE